MALLVAPYELGRAVPLPLDSALPGFPEALRLAGRAESDTYAGVLMVLHCDELSAATPVPRFGALVSRYSAYDKDMEGRGLAFEMFMAQAGLAADLARTALAHARSGAYAEAGLAYVRAAAAVRLAADTHAMYADPGTWPAALLIPEQAPVVQRARAAVLVQHAHECAVTVQPSVGGMLALSADYAALADARDHADAALRTYTRAQAHYWTARAVVYNVHRGPRELVAAHAVPGLIAELATTMPALQPLVAAAQLLAPAFAAANGSVLRRGAALVARNMAVQPQRAVLPNGDTLYDDLLAAGELWLGQHAEATLPVVAAAATLKPPTLAEAVVALLGPAYKMLAERADKRLLVAVAARAAAVERARVAAPGRLKTLVDDAGRALDKTLKL